MLWPQAKPDRLLSRYSVVRTRPAGFSSRLIGRALQSDWREDRRLVDTALDKDAANEVGNGVAGVCGHG